MSDHEQQPAPRRSKVLEALARAERKVFTRPAPKSAKAQVKFLLTRTKDSARNLAERLAVSTRTVERYRAGKLTKPQKRLQAALVEAPESEWPPQVRARSAPPEQAGLPSATGRGAGTKKAPHLGHGAVSQGRARTWTTRHEPKAWFNAAAGGCANVGHLRVRAGTWHAPSRLSRSV
ncbi:hypothetical protein [Streptomyces atratus]|uniref:hypothetical protein n=1 Tax=Streptomyces atratus TaxID=1893 RepID=UPI0036615EBC